ncbi:MAG: hypothetical protein ACLUOB_05035 [Subdoligranulum sp.]
MVTPLAPQRLAGILPRQAVRMVQDALQAAGCPDADYDARELPRIAAGKDPRLLFDPLTRPQAECLAELAAQRMRRVPPQYLAGEWDFLGLTFKVGPGVLCPRADSEVVCETAIELLQQMGKPEPRVLDLCAGTGRLGIGIRHFVPSASVTCVEKARRRRNTCKPTYMAPVCRQRRRMCFAILARACAPKRAADHLQPAVPDRGRDAGPDAGDRPRASYGAGRRNGWVGFLPRHCRPLP